jgi:hypothetical protein
MTPEGSLAAILRPNSPPEFVYKYGPAQRITQILRHRTFYFGPASPQNDLFEFRARSLFTDTPDTKYRFFAKFLIADGSFTDIEEALRSSRDSDPELVAETYKPYAEYLNAYLGLVKEHSGVTCFGSRRNDQRMWATSSPRKVRDRDAMQISTVSYQLKTRSRHP